MPLSPKGGFKPSGQRGFIFLKIIQFKELFQYFPQVGGDGA